MSVGCCQLRNGIVWNADDCRWAEARIIELEEALASLVGDHAGDVSKETWEKARAALYNQGKKE